MTPKDLKRLANGLELLESQEHRQHLIDNYKRFKTTTPFSQRLNDWINNWFEAYKNYFIFTDEDDFDESDLTGTFQKHLKRFKETKKIHIWTGASDKTIFGEPTVNHKFRAWHDLIHLANGLGYDSIGESIVADLQIASLPQDWIFERELIHVEVVGQIHYFGMRNEFVEDQRQFTVDYLINPIEALRLK